MSDLPETIRAAIWSAVHETPAVELRISFSASAFTDAARSGFDSLLTSPAILEEFFRQRGRPVRKGAGAVEGAEDREAYIKSLTPGELADLVWRRVFRDSPPLSEAARTVLTTLGLFGLDVGAADVRELRDKFEVIPPKKRLEKCLALANLELVLYPVECIDGNAGKAPPLPPAFRPVLSLTRLFEDWKNEARKLRDLGFGLKTKVDDFVPLELRRYLAGVLDRLAPVALILDWPSGRAREDDLFRLIREAALALCRERRLAFLLAADCPVDCLAALWEEYPEVNFLFFASREEQLPAAGRAAEKSRNLLICGPDRPLSHPSGFERFLRSRLEESGALFHACHSGAVFPEELVGRWAHLRWTLGEVLLRRYAELQRTGWRLSEAGVKRDIAAILGGNARRFLGITPD